MILRLPRLPAGPTGSARRLCGLVASVALLIALSAPAPAAAMPGPTSLSTGLVDSPVFQDSTDSVRALWLARAHQIGARWVRLNVYWSLIAPFTEPQGFQASDPGDPSYNWTSLDESVREAAADGENVLMLVLAAPTWAQGPGGPASAVTDGAWEPDPTALGAFAHAIALRYSGHFPDPLHPGLMLPLVTHFQAWNEPNLPIYIQPQWIQTSTGAILPASPEIYRGLLNAFYSSVKAVQPRSVVLSAGTAPYGDPPGVGRMAPVVFLRELFCLTPSLAAKACPNPPHLDGLDHHPYAVGPTVKARQPDDISVPDLGKINSIVRAAQRVHHVFPAGPKPLWITELDWSSNPPNPNAPSLEVQAQDVALAFYEVWSQDVDHVFWYQLRDPLQFKKSFTGGGLYFGNGVAKPAAAAFRFPFVALPVPHNKKSVILWGRAPVAGTVAIQTRVGSGWRTVRTLATTAGGIFYAVPRLSPRLELRARIGAFASLGWVNDG